MGYGTEDNVKEVELCATSAYYAYFGKAGALQTPSPFSFCGPIYTHIHIWNLGWHSHELTLQKKVIMYTIT